MWQLIRSFCRISTSIVNDILNQFHDSLLLTSTALTEDLFNATVQSMLHSLRQMASSSFIQSITAVQKITHVNQFISALSTNYIPITKEYGPAPGIFPVFNFSSIHVSTYIGIFENKYILKNSSRICSCKNNVSCPLPSGLYNYSGSNKLGTYDMNKIQPIATVPGLIVDCLPIQTTLSSTLECFYNRTCIDLLLSFYSTPDNISILDETLPSRFNSTTRIEHLINELLVEEIVNDLDYSKYYSHCNPAVCHYKHPSRFNWLPLITTILGLLGGITTILRIVTPYTVQLVLFMQRYCCSRQAHENTQQQNQTIRIRLIRLFRKVETKTIRLNFYTHYSHDRNRLNHGVLSTRLYIVLLLISVCVIVLFSDLSSQIVVERIPLPSIKQYEELYTQYSTDVTCPCTNISLPYGSLMTIQVRYHQICSSDFIQSSWYEVFPALTSLDLKIDFLLFASSYFQTLAIFCDFANITISGAIERFSTTNFVNAQLLSSELFLSTINSSLNTFIESARNEFHYKISLINASLHSNHYVSNMKTNAHLKLAVTKYLNGSYQLRIVGYDFYATDIDYDDCFCVHDATCSLTYEIVLEYSSVNIDWQLEGIRGGCTVMDSVLKSSLICWFKASCLSRLRILASRVGLSNMLPIKPLNKTMISRYRADSSVENILDEMMIEDWNFSYSFQEFYRQCKPSICSFTYEKGTNIIYVITVIISLIGGINVILRLTSPFITKIILKVIDILKHCKSPQIPTVRQENHGLNIIIRNLMARLKHKLIMLNIFDSESNNPRTAYRERMATKLYFLILPFFIYVITIGILYSNMTVDKSVLKPSEEEYNRLLTSHSKLLDCPCEKISIEYKYFVEISTRLHSVCSSDFVRKEWRDYLWFTRNAMIFHRLDIRVRGPAYFSFLSALCQISETTLRNAVDQFLHGTYISPRLLSQSNFEKQINHIVLQFQKVPGAKFAR
ncbi:unnamed protein product, partial [Adineta ricciae]